MPLNTLKQFATEVKIPINECFISLSLPPAIFIQAQREVSPELQAEARDLDAQIAGFSEAIREEEQILQAMGLPLDRPTSDPTGDSLFMGIMGQRIVVQGLQQQRAALAKQLASPIRPQLFLAEKYRLTSFKTADGKGDTPVGTIPFGPGQKETVIIRTKRTSQTTSALTTTAIEENNETASQALNDHVAKSSETNESKDSVDYHMDANFHGEANVTLGGGEVDAKLSVQGGCNTVRNSLSNGVNTALDDQTQQAHESRKQRVSTGTETGGVGTEDEETHTTEMSNTSQTRAMTLIFFPLIEQFTSFLSLVDVEIAFRNGDSTRDRQVPLPQLDQLLSEVVDPASIAKVRQLIKFALEAVLDFQNIVRNIVEEVPFGLDKKILRLTPNLTTDFPAKDGAGNLIQTIHVDGVLIHASSRLLTTTPPQLVSDIVLGEGTIE